MEDDGVRAESLFGSSSRSDGDAMEEDDDDNSLDSSVRSKAPSHQSSHKSETSTTFRLAERIHRKLSVSESEPLPVKWHRSAVNSMMLMRDILIQQRVSADQDVRMLLLYAGISVQRRVALGSDGDEASDLQVSMALLLMLQILCDQQARNMATSPSTTHTGEPMSPSLLVNPLGPHEEGMEESATDAAEECEPVLRAPVAAKRPEEDTLDKWHYTPLKETMKAVDADIDNSWALLLHITPNVVCRACVAEAPRLGDSSLGKLSTLANTFFRCSSLALQYSLLESTQPVDASPCSFLTLSVAEVMMQASDEMRDLRLQAIVDSGESEAGQQVRCIYFEP